LPPKKYPRVRESKIRLITMVQMKIDVPKYAARKREAHISMAILLIPLINTSTIRKYFKTPPNGR
jgi:hypothetical protein